MHPATFAGACFKGAWFIPKITHGCAPDELLMRSKRPRLQARAFLAHAMCGPQCLFPAALHSYQASGSSRCAGWLATCDTCPTAQVGGSKSPPKNATLPIVSARSCPIHLTIHDQCQQRATRGSRPGIAHSQDVLFGASVPRRIGPHPVRLLCAPTRPPLHRELTPPTHDHVCEPNELILIK